MFPSKLPLFMEIIVHLNDMLCGLILLTVVMHGRQFRRFTYQKKKIPSILLGDFNDI
jgi:hypothetical protein